MTYTYTETKTGKIKAEATVKNEKGFYRAASIKQTRQEAETAVTIKINRLIKSL